MKPFLVFLAGVLTVLVAAAVMVLFLFAPAKTGPRQELINGGGQFIAPADRFTVSGTVVVPKALESAVQSGKGHLSIWLSTNSGQQGLRPIVADQLHPVFPFKFSFTFSKDDLSQNKILKKELSITILYRPTDDPGTPLAQLYLEPTVTALFKLPFKEAEIVNKTIPSSFEIGELPFYNMYAHSINDPCLSETTLLAGKITASQSFMEKVRRKNKFALMIYERSSQGWAEAANYESRIVHQQFIDLSSGAGKFSVPMKKTSFPYYFVYVIQCEPGDALAVCGRRAFPLGWEPSKYRNFVMASNLRAPFCGATDFEGVVGVPWMDFFIRGPGTSAMEVLKSVMH